MSQQKLRKTCCAKCIVCHVQRVTGSPYLLCNTSIVLLMLRCIINDFSHLVRKIVYLITVPLHKTFTAWLLTICAFAIADAISKQQFFT